MCTLVDISAAEGENQVTGLSVGNHIIRNLRELREPDTAGNFLRQLSGINAIGILLTGTHDFRSGRRGAVLLAESQQ